MIRRDLEQYLKRSVNKFPVIGVIGPRQSGKTTLVKSVFPDFAYISLEDLDNRLFATEDPRGFLDTYSSPTILDEVQKVPSLFSYLQTKVDQKNVSGQYILTGSQHFLLHEKISQTLAGRIGLFTLLPFAVTELENAHITFETYDEYIFHGMYPRLYEKPVTPADWYPSYIQTYIERDIRDLKQVGNLSSFQTFVKLCAGRIGQLLNLSSLARDCGITHNTAKAWISLLETSFIIYLLRPYYENFGKRLVKMPKLYFFDTGLACSLLGLQQSKDVSTHYLKGSLFENFVLVEFLKTKYHNQNPVDYYFWRDKTGHEVDLLAIKGSTLRAIEIKAGKTIASDYFSDLLYFSKIQKTKKSLNNQIIYGGDITQYQKGVTILGKNSFLHHQPKT